MSPQGRSDPRLLEFAASFQCRWQAVRGTLRYVNSGQYSDILLAPARNLIVKLSYYREGVLQLILRELHRRRRRRAQTILAHEAVTIQNTMARLGNSLIENRISPHFVYFYGSSDCKNFAEELCRQPNLSEGGTHAPPGAAPQGQRQRARAGLQQRVLPRAL